jgi:hypothetical protein
MIDVKLTNFDCKRMQEEEEENRLKVEKEK